MTEKMLTLVSAGLLSRHGFNDGDTPDEYWDWLEDQGHNLDYVRFRWKPVLCRLVEQYVVPALDQKVSTVRIGTSHNPVRAQTVDGRDAERFWHGENEDEAPKLTPEVIQVPMAEVNRLVAEFGQESAQ